MTDAGHPSRHGFTQCTLCSTWRPTAELDAGRCTDVAWCGNQARVGTGRLDADTGERNLGASARSHLDPVPTRGPVLDGASR